MAKPSEFGFEPPLRDPIDREGKVFISNVAWIRRLQILFGRFWSAAPASASAAGKAGDVAYDSGFFYICVADNTWKRVAIASW